MKTLLRAAALPLQFTALLFGALLAFALWMIAGMGVLGVVRVVPLVFVLIALANYSRDLLVAAANGMDEAPVATVDLLAAFRLGPLLLWLLLGGGAAAALLWSAGPLDGALVAGLVLCLWPLALAALMLADGLAGALNPLEWLRTVTGLGAWYLVLLAYAVVLCALNFAAASLALALRLEIGVLSVLSLHAAIGGALHLRRNELDYEPVRSPERAARRAAEERRQQRDRMFDGVYVHSRGTDWMRAAGPLEQWLQAATPELALADARELAARSREWGDPRGLALVTRALVAHLLRLRQPGLALEVFEAALPQVPDLTPATPEELRALAAHARALGRPKLAATLEARLPPPA